MKADPTQNIRTPLIDRTTFPSLPNVPSDPIIWNQHLDMLAELGVSEGQLFQANGRIDALIAEFEGYFSAVILR